MSHTLPKILFNDKEDLININSDSRYVLTAGNINEIKSVVNSLVDDYATILRYDEIFKYIRFNVPKNLIKNQFYSLKIQLSKNPNFSNNQEIICYPTIVLGQNNYTMELNSSSIFSIFKDNIWKSYENLILTKDDEDAEIKINIQNYIKDESSIPYFGRYKLINLKSEDESEWFGFSLGFSNYKDDEFFNDSEILIKLKEIKIVRKS